MPFEGDTFDGCYSFDTFEHIHDPLAAFKEIHRVTKRAGIVFAMFSPIFNAPWGLHVYRELGVPYCQHLWSPDTVDAFIGREARWQLNCRDLSYYREVWQQLDTLYRIVHLTEERDFDGIEIISQHPACFAKVSKKIDDFLISKIAVTLEVRK